MRRSKVGKLGAGNVAVPVNSVAPVISGTPTQGQTLSTTNGTWSNTPTGYNYQWKADGVNISGATANTYLLTASEVGKTLTCSVIAYNALGPGSVALSNSLGPVAAADLVAPTISSPVGTQTGSTTATIGATTNEANGTFYGVVTTSATAPTATQIEAGQNHLGAAATYAGNTAVSSTGAKTLNATGLAASTGYYAHLMHKDAAGNRSNVVSSLLFTTLAGGSLTGYTPSITKTSATGAAPFDFKINGLDFGIVAAGDYIEVDVGTDITSPALDGNGLFVDRATSVNGGLPIYYQLTESDVTVATEDPSGSLSINITAEGYSTVSGDMAVKIRIVRDDGSKSNNSNILTDTISSATTTWTTGGSSGTSSVSGEKHADIIVTTGNPRLATGVIGRGIFEYVRATASTAETKWWVEFTITNTGGLRIGLDDSTINFATYSGFPSGVVDNHGWYFNIGGDSSFWTNGGGSGSVSNSTTWATNDVGMIEVDETTKTVRLYKNGTLVSTNTYSATTLSSGKLFVGCAQNEALTINFGQTAPSSRTPTTGYNIHA